MNEIPHVIIIGAESMDKHILPLHIGNKKLVIQENNVLTNVNKIFTLTRPAELLLPKIDMLEDGVNYKKHKITCLRNKKNRRKKRKK